MNTIKIILSQDGSIATLQKDFSLYQYEYQNKLLNVYAPTSICANQFVDGNITEGCACQIKMTSTNGYGVVKETKSFFMRYVKTLTMNNVEYALFERLLPYAFTIYSGTGINAPTLTISIVNINLQEVDGETIPQIISITNTQTCALEVNASTQVASDEPTDTSDMDTLFALYSDIQTNLLLKQNIALSTATINAISAIINGQSPTQVEPSFIELFNRAVTNATNISSLDTKIYGGLPNGLQAQIDALKQTLTTGVRIIGTMTATDTLPTQQQMDDFRTSQGYTDATNGDIIIIQLTKTNATNELWVANYDVATSLWTTIKMTFLESADNNNMGIVQGTGNEPTTSPNNVIFNISGGKIVDAQVLYGGAWVSIKTRLDDIQTILNQYLFNGDSSLAVPKANCDGNNQNIQATYLTKSLGATKQYVQEYASPKMLQDLYYLDFINVSDPYNPAVSDDEFNTEVVNNTDRNVAIQDANTEYELGTFILELPQDIMIGAKNGFYSKIFIETATTRNLKVKMLVYYLLDSESLGTDHLLGAYESDSEVYTANEIRTSEIQQYFTQLSDPITLTTNDQIKVVYKVVPQTSGSETIKFIANDTNEAVCFIDKQAYVEYVVNTDDYNALSNKPIIQLDLSSENVSDLSTNVIYQHTGLTDSNYTTGWLYIKRLSTDTALDSICRKYVEGAKLGSTQLALDSDFNIVIPVATTSLYDMQDIDTITDNVPTDGSTNLVKSGGVASALANKTNLTIVADTYDSTSTYALKDLVIYEGKLYECTTAVSVAEAFDNTKWTERTIEYLIANNSVDLSNYVTLNGTQTISGAKTFTSNVQVGIEQLRLTTDGKIQMYNGSFNTFADVISRGGNNELRIKALQGNRSVMIETTLNPAYNNTYDLGESSYKWKDLYLSGSLKDGTNSISVANIVAKQDGTTIDTTSTSPITLANNTSFRLGTISALTINAPSSYSLDFTCEVIFTADTGISMTYSAVSPTWSGDDVSGGVFTPVAGKNYTIIFYNSATSSATPSIQAVVRGV